MIFLVIRIFQGNAKKIVSHKFLGGGGGITIKYLDLEALLVQICLFMPCMYLLAHIRTMVGYKAAQGWSNWGRVSTETAVGTLLQ